MLSKKRDKISFNHEILDLSENVEETKVISDEYFIERSFLESPQKGFDLLFKKYYTNLCNHTVRFVYSKEAAEDIVAEVFANFWQNSVYKNISTSYRSYLYSSIRFRAYNTIKFEINRKSNFKDNLHSEDSLVLQPDEILHFDELTKKLDFAIQNLPQQARKAFQLNRLEGKKYAEVAAELQITLSAVEKLISRALSTIRKELRSEWLLSATLFFILS